MSYFIITNEKPTNSSIEALKIKHESEILYLFTTSDERFNNKNYEPIDENGELQNRVTIVLNNIPIAEDGKSAFEERFLNRTRTTENTSVYIAIKVLRQLVDNTSVVITQWESTEAFNDWQHTGSYQTINNKRDTSEGLTQKETLVSEKPYHNI